MFIFSMSVPYVLHHQILRAITDQAFVTGNGIGSRRNTDLIQLSREFVDLARRFTPFGAEYAPQARSIARGYKSIYDAYLQQAEDYLITTEFQESKQFDPPTNLLRDVRNLLDDPSLGFYYVHAFANPEDELTTDRVRLRHYTYLESISTMTPLQVLNGDEQIQNIPLEVLNADEETLNTQVILNSLGMRETSRQYKNALAKGAANEIVSALLLHYPGAQKILFSLVLSNTASGRTNFEPYNFLKPFIQRDTLEPSLGGGFIRSSEELIDQFAIQWAISGFSPLFLRRTLSTPAVFDSGAYIGLLKAMNSVVDLSVAVWVYLLLALQSKELARDRGQYAVYFKLRAVSMRKKIENLPSLNVPDTMPENLPDAVVDLLGPFYYYYDYENGPPVDNELLEAAGLLHADQHAFPNPGEAVPDQGDANASYSIRRLTVPSASDQGGFFMINDSTTLHDVLILILNGIRNVFHANTPHSANLFSQESDFIMITGLDIHVKSTTYPNPMGVINPEFGNIIPLANQMRSLLQLSLARLRAFAVPEAMYSFYGRVGVTIPFLGSNDDCIIEAFCYLLCWKECIELPSLPKKEIKERVQATLDTYSREQREHVISLNGYLLDALRYLMSLQEPGFDLIIGFFSGFNAGKRTPPAFPMLRLTLNDDQELEFHTPADGLYFSSTEVHDFEHMLIYYQSHVWPCTVGGFRVNIASESTEERRLYATVKDNPPDSHVLKPIYLSGKHYVKEAEKNSKRIRFVPVSGGIGKMNEYGGYYNAQHNIDSYSGDFETDTCVVCSEQQNANIQECFSACLAWGTSPNESVTFNGQECPVLNRGKKLDESTGCVSRMLNFIKKSLGAYQQFRPTMHATASIVTRRIWFFNGGRFDALFIVRTALFWRIPTQPVISNGKIMSLKLWNNVEITDFANIWPGYSLDALYKEFQLGEQVPNLFIPKAKWACFPYLLIAESAVKGSYKFSLDEMISRGSSIWGGKCAVKPQKNQVFTPAEVVEHNIRWWRDNIGLYYCADEHLGDYCRDDTSILQYMVVTDHELYSKGEFNSRPYDHSHAITASQGAMLFFRQTCLEEPIVSPDPKLKYTIFGKEYDMTTLLGFAYHGGKVEVFRHTSEDPRYTEKHRKYYEETGDIVRMDDYDVNSMYPSAMIRPMPVKFLEASFQDEGVVRTEFIDTDIYLVEIEYKPGDCGIMGSFNGYNLAPSKLDVQYYDPFIKGTRLTLVYGVELNSCSKRGARVTCFGAMRFEAKDIFKKYIEELYTQRLASKTKMRKNFLKLKMNSTYGKVAQKLMGSLSVFYTLFDMECSQQNLEDVLVGVDWIDDGQGNDVIFASFIDSKKASIGEHKAIAGYVTAVGHTIINDYTYFVEQLEDEAGCPIEVVCIDTDSAKHRIPAKNHPLTQVWLDQFMHPTRLGFFKSETDGVGFDYDRYHARKTYIVHKFDPTDFKKPGEDGVEFLNKRKRLCDEQVKEHPETAKPFNSEMIMKHKGITHGCVDPMKMIQVSSQDAHAELVSFKLPVSFQRSLKHGIIRVDDMQRTMKVQNYTRTLPDENGCTRPHASFQAFQAHLEALSKFD